MNLPFTVPDARESSKGLVHLNQYVESSRVLPAGATPAKYMPAANNRYSQNLDTAAGGRLND